MAVAARAIKGPVEDARRAIGAYLERTGVSQAEVARQAGVSPAALSEWIRGRYRGNNKAVATAVQSFLADRQMAPAPMVAPGVVEFVWTEAAKSIDAIVRYARAVRGMALVWGDPGRGKTMTLAHYRDQHPGEVVWLTATPHHDRSAALLDDLLVAAGLPTPGNGVGRRVLFGTLVSALSGNQERLCLVIDEAQHLSLESLEELRALHDATQIPVVLAGNEVVFERLHGKGRPGWAQLYSRIALQYRVPREIPVDDVRALAGAGVGEDAVRHLAGIARRGGSLRAVSNCLRIARTIAQESEREVTVMDLRAAEALLMPGA